MDKTALLDLPYIMPSQAQKHVTHNEALRMLDALVLLAVSSRALASPPDTPVAGVRYIVAADAAGDFDGHENEIALFSDGGWIFMPPHEGWLAWCSAENQLLAFAGGNWVETGARAGGTQNVPMVGVNTAADETNRLAAAADATLLTHDGDGHQLKVNKAGASHTASLVFQTAYSGRAEMGLAGTDAFSIKVSPDGDAWHSALTVDPQSGAVSVPGITIGGLDPASPANPADNRTLGIDASGAVTLRKTAFPTFSMSGADGDMTIVRDYDAQVEKGTGLYLGDSGGAIAHAPNSSWFSTSITGVAGVWFGQLTVTDKDLFFRGGHKDDPSTATWYTLAKQSGMSDGHMPCFFVSGNDSGFVDSDIVQGDGNVGIGTNAPDPSALLDLAADARGFLPPRMSEGERDAIAAPAEGLIVYNLTQNVPQFWNGSAWVGMAAG